MDYNNGKIYVIRNHCNDMVYIGSTTQSLSKRFSKHKWDCNRRTSPLYNAMNELYFGNFYIELVEEYPCDNKEQLCAKEGYYIRQFDSYNNGYNGRIEGRSKKQYCEENKDKIKQWREDNKETIQEYNKQYRIDNKEKIQQYREDNKDKIKQYIEDNKEHLRKGWKQYRENNKDKISELKKRKFDCECGSMITLQCKARHLKTKKHLKYIEKREDEFEGI